MHVFSHNICKFPWKITNLNDNIFEKKQHLHHMLCEIWHKNQLDKIQLHLHVRMCWHEVSTENNCWRSSASTAIRHVWQMIKKKKKIAIQTYWHHTNIYSRFGSTFDKYWIVIVWFHFSFLPAVRLNNPLFIINFSKFVHSFCDNCNILWNDFILFPCKKISKVKNKKKLKNSKMSGK